MRLTGPAHRNWIRTNRRMFKALGEGSLCLLAVPYVAVVTVPSRRIPIAAPGSNALRVIREQVSELVVDHGTILASRRLSAEGGRNEFRSGIEHLGFPKRSSMVIGPRWVDRHGVEGWVHEELVRQAQKGDAEAFDALARTVGDRCQAIAMKILRDRNLAEDVGQLH